MLFRLVSLRLRSQSLHPTVRGRVEAWHDQTLLMIYATLQTLLLGEDPDERQTRDLRLRVCGPSLGFHVGRGFPPWNTSVRLVSRTPFSIVRSSRTVALPVA